VEAWRSRLDAEQVGLIELVTRRGMRRYGYEPDGSGTRPGPALLARYTAAVGMNQARLLREHQKERTTRRHELNPVADATS
jgi:hypothetical protein